MKVSDIELGTDELLIGSDEEKALIKAVKVAYPNAGLMLCTRHLKENARRRLIEKTGADKIKTIDVLDKIFGPNGLTEADDLFTFDETVMNLMLQFESEIPLFCDYFRNKLAPGIREFVLIPRLSNSDRVPIHWTNNNCESINNILKLTVHWKPHKIIDLIDKLYDVVRLHYKDMRRAFYGEGNFKLDNSVLSFRIPKTVWQTKTEEQKEAHLRRFISHRLLKEEGKFVTSTDGKLKIPKTPATAKKPGQKKRCRTAKTTTNKKRKT